MRSVQFCRPLLAVVIVGAIVTFALPAAADYTKLYRFTNATTSNKAYLRVITNGLEVLTNTYCEPGWPEPAQGYVTMSGLLNTSLTWGKTAAGGGSGITVPPGGAAAVGWTTADGSCRLKDIRWVKFDGTDLVSISPSSNDGIPGGGLLTYDAATDAYTWTITNDTGKPLNLSDTEFGVFDNPLDIAGLGNVMDVGMLGLRVEEINQDIRVIWDEIAAAAVAGRIPSPSARSMQRKLELAIENNNAAYSFYRAGNIAKAKTMWAKAAGNLQNFISEVTNGSNKGNLPQDLYARWVPLAQAIIADLLALPEGIQSPVEDITILPGDSYSFPVPKAQLGNGLVLQGVMTGPEGELQWLEQVKAEPPNDDTVPPQIVAASVSPLELWPPDHEMIKMALNVTVVDLNPAGIPVTNPPWAPWYVASVTSSQPENGSGDGDVAPDWLVDPNDPQVLSLRRERSGNEETRVYSVTLLATDPGGNLSAPFVLRVPVTHDGSDSGTITTLAAAPTSQGAQITFTLAGAGNVQAEVLNIAGRPVATVANRAYEAGTHSVAWNGRSARGLAVPAGTYLIRLTTRTADGQQASRVTAVSIGRK